MSSLSSKETCEEKLEVGSVINMFKNFCWEEKERSRTVLEIKYKTGNKKRGKNGFSKEKVQGSKEVAV